MVSLQSKAYYLETYVSGAWKKLGIFFRAGSDALPFMQGKYIFLRILKRDLDTFMHKYQTTGMSSAALDKIKSDGAEYVVSYSRESGLTIIAPIDAYTISANYGQGVQTHAPLDKCQRHGNERLLNYPVAVPKVVVKDEQVDEPALFTPFAVVAEVKAKAVTRACGCRFLDGRIDKSCEAHKAAWRQ